MSSIEVYQHGAEVLQYGGTLAHEVFQHGIEILQDGGNSAHEVFQHGAEVLFSDTETDIRNELNKYHGVKWLFEITKQSTGTVYRFSTIETTYGGHDYAFRIFDFNGVEINRNQSEFGIYAPSDISFSFSNKLNFYNPNFLHERDLLIKLVLTDEDGVEYLARQYRFFIRNVEATYNKMRVYARDYISTYLNGTWPNTRNVNSIGATGKDDDVCVPVTYGKAYISLRPIWITDKRQYLLGDSGIYGIQQVREPENWNLAKTFENDEYSFIQELVTIDGDSFKVFRPIIADYDGDGVVESAGLWRSGQAYQDIPALFWNEETKNLRNPVRILRDILEDFGIPESLFDDGSFDAAAGYCNANGIYCDVGYWMPRSRQDVVVELLQSANAILDISEKIEIRITSAESAADIYTVDVLRGGDAGEGTFSYSAAESTSENSGYVAYREEDSPQFDLKRLLVPAFGLGPYISSTKIIELPLITDPDIARKLARLYIQKTLLRQAEVSFEAKPYHLFRKPDQILNIAPSMYAGSDDGVISSSYRILIDSIAIARDLRVSIRGTRYKYDPAGYDDWTPPAIEATLTGEDETAWNDDGGVTTYETTPSTITTDDTEKQRTVDIGTFEIDRIATGSNVAFRWWFSIKSTAGTSARTGLLIATWAGTTADVTGDIAVDIGATVDDISFSVDIESGEIVLRVVSTAGSWEVKTKREAI